MGATCGLCPAAFNQASRDYSTATSSSYLREEVRAARAGVAELDKYVAKGMSFKEISLQMSEEASRALSRLEQVGRGGGCSGVGAGRQCGCGRIVDCTAQRHQQLHEGTHAVGQARLKVDKCVVKGRSFKEISLQMS